MWPDRSRNPFLLGEWRMSGGSDLGEQIGGAIEQLEQLDQGQRRLGLAVLVAREGIDATAKNFSRLPLVEIELPAYLGDVARIDVSGIHLALERAHPFAVAVAMLTIEDNFTASSAKAARHCRDRGGFALVGVAHVARVVDQCRRAAAWAFHGHSSLKETIDTPSMTVSFRYTSAPLAVLVCYTSCQTRGSAWVVMLLQKSAGVSARTTAHIPAKSSMPSSRAPLKALAVALTSPASIKALTAGSLQCAVPFSMRSS